MTSHDRDWWQARAVKRYRQLKALEDRIEKALAAHDDCWPDDPCSELAHDIRAAIHPVQTKRQS